MGSTIERIQSSGIQESDYITGRLLSQYEWRLGFDRNLLEGQNVLNFGCGGSNLTRDIRKSGVTANVVEIDLANDPIDKSTHFMYTVLSPALTLLEEKTAKTDSSLSPKITNLKRRLGGIHDRNFTQADGRDLSQFADQTFDTTLALSVTYQIPQEEREKVWKELLRVSKAIHAGPINGEEYAMLQRLAEEEGYEIVYSQDRPPVWKALWNPLKIKSVADYDNYIENTPPEKRLTTPPTLPNKVRRRNEKVISASAYGNLVILKRKQPEIRLSSDEQNRVGDIAAGAGLVAA